MCNRPAGYFTADFGSSKVDRSKLRNGDTVYVRGVICDENVSKGPNVAIKFENGWPTTAHPIGFDQIVGHEPRELKVGDRVRFRTGYEGRICAIDGGEAWVKLDSGVGHSTYYVAELERVS